MQAPASEASDAADQAAEEYAEGQVATDSGHSSDRSDSSEQDSGGSQGSGSNTDGPESDGNDDDGLPPDTTCAHMIRVQVNHLQEVLQGVVCRHRHPVTITALMAALTCVQCTMKLSLLQFAGHCVKCSFVCIQCFVSVNRKVSYDGRIDTSDNRQLEMMGERLWGDKFEVLDMDMRGRLLENHDGMTRYGIGTGRLAYGLLLNEAACELAVKEVLQQ